MSIFIQNEDKPSMLHFSGDKIGTYYLTNNPKYYEPQRSNNFIFYISGLNDALNNIVGNDYAKGNAEDIIRLSVSKAFVPHFSQSAISIKRGNNTMKFAGVPEFSSGDIELVDYIGAGTKEVLLAWQKQSYDPTTEKVGLASDYKKTAYLLEYTPDYQLVRTWKLYGCWISKLSEGEYSSDSNDKRSIQVTIEYDKAMPDTSDIE